VNLPVLKVPPQKTHNIGERLKSQNRNTSLLVLGRCLMSIRDNQMNKSEILVPFRDSKLTRRFQRAMSGRESLAMIVSMNPSPLLREVPKCLNMFSCSKTDNFCASQTYETSSHIIILLPVRL